MLFLLIVKNKEYKIGILEILLCKFNLVMKLKFNLELVYFKRIILEKFLKSFKEVFN